MAKPSLPQEMQKSSDQVKFFYELVGRLNNRIQGSQVFFIFFFTERVGSMLSPGEYFNVINAHLQFHIHQERLYACLCEKWFMDYLHL